MKTQKADLAELSDSDAKERYNKSSPIIQRDILYLALRLMELKPQTRESAIIEAAKKCYK